MHALLLAVTLILQSGDRIVIEGSVRQENGILIFRSGGLLYSVPVAEVARVEETERAAKEEQEKPKMRLRVSEERLKELIAELEKNHSGTPPPPPPAAPKSATPETKAEEQQDETAWRVQARTHEENIRRAREDVAMLQSRAEQLENEIRTLLALGFTPRDFTYQTTQLARTRERIPPAQLEVTRAERAFEQFREEARRAGVLPGWLR